MKYIKWFEQRKGIPNVWVGLLPANLNIPPSDEEENLIDYLQEFFDKHSIKLLSDIMDDNGSYTPEIDTNNYMIYHDDDSTVSIDIYNDINKVVYKDLLSIQPNIEKRLGYMIRTCVEDYSRAMSLYNIRIYISAAI